MCGITGFIEFKKPSGEDVLQRMTAALGHRGPDGAGISIHAAPHARIGFGHRRLSIIDLSECGKQPMHYKHLSITFNGEIYNYAEIREELAGKGHEFVGHSDTEVILHAYEEWGVAMLQRFIGMFAFAIYNEREQEVLLFRDRAGVKPLYYYRQDGLLLFGSELKALTAHPDFPKTICHTALQLYFQYGYIKAPHTIYRHCYKLLPGHFLRFSLARQQMELTRYWDVAIFYQKPVLSVSEEEAIAETEKLLISAAQYRMVADVPVGVFLSGGYDSSLVAALLQKNNRQKLKTFTIGFEDDAYNEAGHARRIASFLGTDHHEYICTSQEAKEIISSLPAYYDEPFGDSSAIPTILVSRFARQHVTVALSADGGDEIFAGYNRYDQLTRLRKLNRKMPVPVRKLSSVVLRNSILDWLPFGKKHAFRRHKLAEVMAASGWAEMSDRLSRHFTNEHSRALLPLANGNNEVLINNELLNGGKDFINALLLADYKTYLVDDILTKVDRATMSVSLEGREPLLDHRIIEWAAALPAHFKYRNGEKKYLLKKIAWNYLPKELLERPKQGFGVPVNDWMRNDLRGLVLETINENELRRHNLLNEKLALQIRDNHLKGYKADQQLWLLLMFQLWWNRWAG